MNYEVHATETNEVNFLIDNDDNGKVYKINYEQRAILQTLKNLYENGDDITENIFESVLIHMNPIEFSNLEETRKSIEQLKDHLYNHLSDLNELIKDGNDVEINKEIRKETNSLIANIEKL